jgi:hypothetical protein
MNAFELGFALGLQKQALTDAEVGTLGGLGAGVAVPGTAYALGKDTPRLFGAHHLSDPDLPLAKLIRSGETTGSLLRERDAVRDALSREKIQGHPDVVRQHPLGGTRTGKEVISDLSEQLAKSEAQSVQQARSVKDLYNKDILRRAFHSLTKTPGRLAALSGGAAAIGVPAAIGLKRMFGGGSGGEQSE